MSLSIKELIVTAGIPVKKDAFVVIIKTEWNAHVVSILEEGCIEILNDRNINFKVVEVPGAFEIPFAIKQRWEASTIQKPDAFIALGCVIRGSTPHFEYVCEGVTQGIMQLNITLPVPVIYGVLTVNSQMEADERTGGRHGHKGKEAAAAAIKMMAVKESFNNA
jgi:6,7-dimethyl-8-ribityllumazine synthase